MFFDSLEKNPQIKTYSIQKSNLTLTKFRRKYQNLSVGWFTIQKLVYVVLHSIPYTIRIVTRLPLWIFIAISYLRSVYTIIIQVLMRCRLGFKIIQRLRSIQSTEFYENQYIASIFCALFTAGRFVVQKFLDF